ncbi:MAG: phosphoadenylyl-sulfate reductase [PS1 clade bacterium]|uniref:Adenosine 5'-phosphosulfate reductase n=1 Tax=PS1 clade bacterium TaxID=2175152 RepID=A0A368E1G0_9PROT|nr:MAG: phosphoadenylyl-sulfate reductase [PS1 clade bacterium]HCV48623.1 phosphoadenylyl-sulfate reductase [Rhodobiaceae bacterium]|tara:strand:+ start:169 stop:942 length:774 start_codon:yes stop_codon:yes gene_type:complete
MPLSIKDGNTVKDREVLEESLSLQAKDMLARTAELSAVDFLTTILRDEFKDEICVVSSFGAESAVLLYMVAQIDPTIPVIFLNTGKLFGETLRYRDRLQTLLGLTDVRSIGPHPTDLAETDSNEDLWQKNNDMCCHIRKFLPQERALKGFKAVLTGRKRFQTTQRGTMQRIEIENETAARLRINPLADFTLDDLQGYLETHNLPKHPLVKDGYLSIGCMPCTDKVKEGDDYRSGRWSEQDKEECGMHGTEFVYGEGI